MLGVNVFLCNEKRAHKKCTKGWYDRTYTHSTLCVYMGLDCVHLPRKLKLTKLFYIDPWWSVSRSAKVIQHYKIIVCSSVKTNKSNVFRVGLCVFSLCLEGYVKSVIVVYMCALSIVPEWSKRLCIKGVLQISNPRGLT